jgi:hypothetical protein
MYRESLPPNPSSRRPASPPEREKDSPPEREKDRGGDEKREATLKGSRGGELYR